MIRAGSASCSSWRTGAPQLLLRDETGTTRARLAAFQRMSYLHFYDAKGEPRLELACGEDWARLSMVDKESSPRADFGFAGKTVLGLYDEQGRGILEVLKEGPRFIFYDGAGKPLFSKP